MEPVKIRGAIMFNTGLMPNAFAKAHGFHQTTLHRVITGESKSQQIRGVISKAIKLPESKLWPEKAA